MNIYLIASQDKITIDEKINEIRSKNKDIEVVFYDLMVTPIEKLVEDLDTYNFLSNSKLIVGTNASFLSSERTKKEVEHNLDIFEKYIDNPSEENILVLTVDSLDKRKKITSHLLKKCELIEELTDINSLIKKKFEDYKISNMTISKLIDYCGNNHERIFNEIEKLKLFKVDTKEITDSDIEEIVSKSLDDNMFHFIDSILSGNKKYAFELYNNFILHGEQVVHMIILLSNKIRLMYQVKVLCNDGNGDKTISKILSVHEYPVKLAREAGYKYSEKTLLKYLEKLAKIDLDIKSGNSDGTVEFEMLLAEI